jgi:MFS family permease
VKKVKKSFIDGLVISILFITALANSAYAIIAPFLPLEFERKGIDQSWIGYIFASYSVAVIFASPFVAYIMPTFGRRNLILTGMLTMGISFILFGFTSYIDDN